MAGQDKSLWRRDGEIFILSALILFLELALIRWIGTEVPVFAYLGNLVLVVCFFGIGLGCYQAARPASLTRLLVNLLVLVALIANPLHLERMDLRQVTLVLRGFDDLHVWGEMITPTTALVLVGLGVVAALMYLLACTFIPLGQLLGRAFEQHPHLIRAYSVNVAGSLAGVWLLNLLSWLSWPPALWFEVLAVLMAMLLVVIGRREWWAVALVMAAGGLTWLGRAPATRTIWSPYQKLTLSPSFIVAGTNRVAQGYQMDVNGTIYQSLLNLSEEFLRAHPEIFDLELAKRSHYNLPFNFKSKIRRMLIVGAGTGNNAAAALRHGVEQVDCVEIDPQIYALGKELHPEHPYDSPRVHMIVNDARAFFKQARGPYDVIWFGLLDSHTLGSSYNNLRLDHYVYTRESFGEAKRLLADDGRLVVNFEAKRWWIADRLFRQVRDVFGQEPIAYNVSYPPQYGTGGGVTLIGGRAPVTPDDISQPALRALVQRGRLKLPGTARPTTDDWPYLYLERARIPKLHLVVTAAILVAVALARRRVLDLNKEMGWHFFALGAAFLLLEVQTVSRATLLFGMTWLVNAIVISAVLVMILLSNLAAARWPRLPQWFIVVGLAVTVPLLALVPLDWFNALTGTTKLVAASAFLTAPVFFAGLIFIRSFAACADKSQALGSNLIGALVGGLLESVSFVTGIRALVVLVGLFYVLALWLRPRTVAMQPRLGSAVLGRAS